MSTSICKAIVLGGTDSTRRTLDHFLNEQQFSVYAVDTLQELRSLLVEHETVLVLVDLDVNTEAQLQACHALKSSTETILLPILAVSGSVERRWSALEAGVDECLLWPIKATQFQTRVQTLLRLAATRRQLSNAQLEVEIERRQHLRSAFRRYVSPQLADEIISRLDMRNGEVDANMAWNSRTRAAVLFADMRGFTGVAERLTPPEVFDLLNEFFAQLTAVAFKYDGTVFHMAGDCLMVGFGVPIQQPDSAQRAIKTAREMLFSFAQLAQQWKARYHVETGLGIGINEGEVIAGNVGSAHYMNYTLIGDTVNVASRLSQRARAGEVLFSNAFKLTLDARGIDVGAVELPPMVVRGRSNPIDIFCMPIEQRSTVSTVDMDSIPLK